MLMMNGVVEVTLLRSGLSQAGLGMMPNREAA